MREEISVDERVSRFIIKRNRKHYTPTTLKVKYKAFMPNRHGETSVFRISGLDENDIFDLGRKYVAAPQNSPLDARADLLVRKILKFDLKIEPQPDPHPRHASIINWPQDVEDQRDIAFELAAEAGNVLLDPEREQP